MGCNCGKKINPIYGEKIELGGGNKVINFIFRVLFAIALVFLIPIMVIPTTIFLIISVVTGKKALIDMSKFVGFLKKISKVND